MNRMLQRPTCISFLSSSSIRHIEKSVFLLISIVLFLLTVKVSANDGIAFLDGQPAYEPQSTSPVFAPRRRMLQGGNGNKPPHANGGPSTQPTQLIQPLSKATLSCPLVNIAMEKSATQKSTGFGGVASRAVDGDSNPVYNSGSISHTLENDNPWWMVDLGGAYDVQQVVIWNRLDCCSERLSGAKVRLLRSLSTDGVDYTAEATLPSMDNEQIFEWDAPNETNEGIVGVYVLLPFNGTYLSLAEVEVFASNCSTSSYSSMPSAIPSSEPTMEATASLSPSQDPSKTTSSLPSQQPTSSKKPSSAPTRTVVPSQAPSMTLPPSFKPTNSQSAHPSQGPTMTVIPTLRPSSTSIPSPSPTATKSSQPSQSPTMTVIPTLRPSSTSIPSPSPTATKSSQPSQSPTMTVIPTLRPSSTSIPSPSPTATKSSQPSHTPSHTRIPSQVPTFSTSPTELPSTSLVPTLRPTLSVNPSEGPSNTIFPSQQPTANVAPSISPSEIPTISKIPSDLPTNSKADTPIPTTSNAPSLLPTYLFSPSILPTRTSVSPSALPSHNSPAPIIYAEIPTVDEAIVSGAPSSIPNSDDSAVPSDVPRSASPILSPPFGDQVISFESSHPSDHPSFNPTTEGTELPSSRPSLRPTITNVPSALTYQFPKIALLLRGNQAIVSGAGRSNTRRNLQGSFDECDSLLLDLVRNRIRSEIVSIVGFFEYLYVELDDVSKQYNVDKFTLVYTFDLQFEIRSPLEEHDLQLYVKNGFDSDTDENFILQYLQAGECPVFAFASGFDIVVSSPIGSLADESESIENNEQIKSDSTSQTVLISGSAAAAGAGIVLLGVFIAVRFLDRNNTQPESPMSMEGNFHVDYQQGSGRDGDILSEIGVRTTEEVSTLGGNFPEAGSMESQQEEYTNESFSLNYEFKKVQNPSCSDQSGSEVSASREQILTDDDTLGGQYAAGEIFEVRAPSGLLGIVLETAKDGVPTVTNIRDSSVLANDVKIGDRLISVDGVDCFCLLATDISQMIARKQKQDERVFVFARPMNKEGSLSSVPEE